jgi:hypothetical protein
MKVESRPVCDGLAKMKGFLFLCHHRFLGIMSDTDSSFAQVLYSLSFFGEERFAASGNIGRNADKTQP